MSLNPATPLSLLEQTLEHVDLVLVLAVDPGFGGQTYIPSTTTRIARLRAVLDRRGRGGVHLEVDGGVKAHNAAMIADAGATVLVAGSAIFNKELSVADSIAALREQAGVLRKACNP